MRTFYVYIMTNRSRTLYTGVTNDLERRLLEHKAKLIRGFTSKYNITMLVWFEEFAEIDQAIEAEKRIKGWRRSKKISLIESNNPDWRDLAEHLDRAAEVHSRPQSRPDPSVAGPPSG